MTEISSQDRNLQRTVKQILDDTMHGPISRISERICEQRGGLFLFHFLLSETLRSFFTVIRS